ncbi:MAG TPA: glycosyltransferase [Solirubrobacteraceae bacterium]|jgi:cellulose synthase/poly-beta-1,6-N-acetylglucosamine synthase-like glycosyltransferase
MLSALLLAGLFAAPIATVALFLPAAGRAGRAEARSKRIARLTAALAWSAILVAVVAGILDAIGVTVANLEAGAAGLVLACVVWLPVTRRWNARAHVCWATTTYVFVVYLVFMAWWTFASHLGLTGDIGGMVLWLLEVVAATLGCAYLWELCDTLGRASWVRRIGTQELAELPDGPYPFVCLQVPCYNEPPDMVIETLNSLRSLDYPNYEIQVLDDNTDDESLWRPVEGWCKEHDVKFVHLSDWPGYKSGALNYALGHMVEDSCELIGVIDSDYQIEPHFLRRCAPLFADEKVGFIQAPQDYRDWQEAPFYRRLYYSYHYFFAVSQPSRNERDGAIFAGTMGLIRRRALEQAGGWDEWCITEDAELSLRILRNGWSGLHVDKSFGKGIMPLTFEALKGQRFRWCFGGIQILRRHWRSMLPGRETKENRLSLGQRWAYLCGGIQWYGDLLALLFFVCLLVGAANIAFSGGLVFRKLTGFLLAAIPLLVVLGLLRAVALLRRGTGASWRDALGAFLIWQSTTLTVTSASVQGLFAKEAAFLRTPKTHGDPRWSDALKANWLECVFGVLGLLAIAGALSRTSPGGVLLAALLAWPTVSFLAAPYNSLSAQHAALPPELRERRRTEYLRYGTRRLTFAVGGLGLAGGTAALALGLFVPGTANIVAPQLLGPAKGHPVHYGQATTPSASNAPQANSKSSDANKSKGSGGSTTSSTTSTATTTATTTTSSTASTPTTTSETTSTAAPTATTAPTTTTGTTTTGATTTTSTAPSTTTAASGTTSTTP